MVKATSHRNDVPQVSDKGISPKDLGFNPALLRLVGAVIEETSGLNTQNIFQPPVERYKVTVQYALKMLEEMYAGEEENVARVASMRMTFEEAIAQMDST